MAIYTSEFLNILEERGFIHQCTDFDALDKLLSTETVTAYCGVDPTAPSMHVGHLIPYMMLSWFQKSGHKPIILVGGCTAKIGDPKADGETRKILSAEDVATNVASLKKTFERFFTFGDGDNDAMMVDNSDWLEKLNYIEFLRDYGRHFTINRMLSMESVKQRLERESPLTFLEFNYMLLQGYDYLELYRQHGCRLQMAGSDQWGNIIQGVELGRRVEKAEMFGLTAPLLTTASGKKMGKTEAGAVWLDPDLCSPYGYYQYWRNCEDADVIKLLKLFTELPMEEIAKLAELKGVEVNEAKKILAFEATKFCHGTDAAKQAEKTAQQTFEQGASAQGLPTIEVDRARLEEGIPAFILLKEAGLVASNGEARRLIKGGGAKLNDEKIANDDQMVTIADLDDDSVMKLSAGKKKHALVKPAA